MKLSNKLETLRRTLLRSTYFKRFLFFFLADLALIVLSLFLSFVFHFDFSMNVNYMKVVAEVLPMFVLIKMISFLAFRIYKITWRYVGIFDLANIVVAMVVSAMALTILSMPIASIPFELPVTGFPKRIIFEDCIISIILISGLRIAKRFYLEVIRKRGPKRKGKRAVIIGAGNTGEMIIRNMARLNFAEYYPVCLLDDDKSKLGTYIHGVKVVDSTDRLSEVIVTNYAKAVIVAIPSLNHKALRKMYSTAKNQNVDTVKIVPRIYGFDQPDINLKNLEEIGIEDLIGRQAITVDYQGIEAFLQNESVLITGAGGSIGSEITRQVCSFSPKSLVLFDIDETELHNLGLKLDRLFPHLSGRLTYITGDIRDKTRVEEVFGEFSPRVIFHAAAYKHVPMMEHNPKEAVKVNMFGTYALAEAAVRHGVMKFIMISTDKAVRPTSVMGATKRLAEYICMAFNEEGGNLIGAGANGQSTRFVSVRFGNVLGSRGSVLPLFLDQLKDGGPLTVTHEEMKRYFMTIPEAVSLVLQASVIGSGGEVLVLDMGEPVRIVEVAEELIRLHGLKPYHDIDIKFTGLRPGEKLFEEILTSEEGTEASRHEKIYRARNSQKYTIEEIGNILAEFRALACEPSIGNGAAAKMLLKKYVKYYEEV